LRFASQSLSSLQLATVFRPHASIRRSVRSIQPSTQFSPKRRRRFQVRNEAPWSPSLSRAGRTACGGCSRKRASRPAAGVTITGWMTSAPRERKRWPSGSTNHQRPSFCSTRKKPVASAFVPRKPP
jgi:hypothetical protein